MLNRTRKEKRERVFLKLVLSGSFWPPRGHPRRGTPWRFLVSLILSSTPATTLSTKSLGAGEVGITVSSARPGCFCHCRHLLPPVSAPCFCRTLAPQNRWSSQARQLGFVEPFPASQGARVHPGPMRSQTGPLALTAAANHVRKHELAPEFALPIGHVRRCFETGRDGRPRPRATEGSPAVCRILCDVEES